MVTGRFFILINHVVFGINLRVSEHQKHEHLKNLEHHEMEKMRAENDRDPSEQFFFNWNMESKPAKRMKWKPKYLQLFFPETRVLPYLFLFSPDHYWPALM